MNNTQKVLIEPFNHLKSFKNYKKNYLIYIINNITLNNIFIVKKIIIIYCGARRC